MPHETEREMVERHIRQSERHIAAQQDVLLRLREMALSTVDAEAFMSSLHQVLDLHRQHLARILQCPPSGR
jgi:alkylation response protein AidB-like acyl-CoA dehydrogenase